MGKPESKKLRRHFGRTVGHARDIDTEMTPEFACSREGFRAWDPLDALLQG